MSGSKGHIVSSTLWDITQNIAPCEEGIWIPESAKHWIPGFGIRMQPKESGIPLTIGFGIQNPLTKAGIQFLESGIQGVESTMQDCLGFPYFGQKISRIQNIQSKIAAIHLGSQWSRNFKTSFRKISPWLTAYKEEHFDGLLVIAGTFAIRNRLDWVLHGGSQQNRAINCKFSNPLIPQNMITLNTSAKNFVDNRMP